MIPDDLKEEDIVTISEEIASELTDILLANIDFDDPKRATQTLKEFCQWVQDSKSSTDRFEIQRVPQTR